jgi:hypothetical protein
MRKARAKPQANGATPYARSRITNGSVLLPCVDGRSLWARRARDLIQLTEQDVSGGDPERLSQAARSIIRRAAVLSVELEHLEVKFAQAEATPEQLMLYSRLANTQRRLLQAVGLERRLKSVASLSSILRPIKEAAE